MNAVSSIQPNPEPELIAFHADPDAALLTLCAKLREQEREWQRLWDATPDEHELGSEADDALDAYSEDVYPGYQHSLSLCDGDYRTTHGGDQDLLGQLRCLAAVTPDGMRAKAAAIKAAVQPERYTEGQREDMIYLGMSLADDVAAGTATHLGTAPQHLPNEVRS